MVSTLFSSLLSPGVYLKENSAGVATPQLASHITSYIIGFGSLGPTATPTKVNSLVDFTNQFGSSLSENSVKLYFRNKRDGILYFINTAISDTFSLEVTGVTAGSYTVIVNGEAIAITAVSGDTIDTIRTKVINAVNLNAGDIVSAQASTTDTDTAVIRADDPATTLVITSAAAIFTITNSTPTYPVAADFVYAIEQSFDPDEGYAQGFILAPEVFQNLAAAASRLSVATAMRDLAAADGYDWLALIDNHPDLTTVAELQTDALQYTTTKGHLAYYAPYLTDLEDNPVPPSAAIAGLAATRYESEGFHQPIGGNKYTVLGVKDVVVRYIKSDQDVLNPIGCNLVRNLRNKGVKIWGMRTRSSDPLYTFVHTRVIMNVLNGTLRISFDNFPFSAIDGMGVLFHLIEQTGMSVCRKMYNGRALFGATEDEAFKVRCNFENNSLDDLENGNALCEIFVAPVPGLEKLLLLPYRVPIGQVQQAAALAAQ